MGSNWPSVRLGDHCQKIGSGATPKGGSSVYLDAGETCLIRSQNIYNDGFSESGLAYITEEAAGKLKNVAVKPGDVLLNITGDSVARVCMVDEKYLPARVNQHVAIIRVNRSDFDPRFIRYFLASHQSQALLLTLASAGATRNALTKGMLEDLEVPKPPLQIQVKIADILEAPEEKIRRNRQINTTLESMAQVMFKSWFVDFDPVIDNALAAGNPIPDALQARSERRAGVSVPPLPGAIRQLFPSSFVLTEEMGWVPEGWGLSQLSEVTSQIIDHRGKTPKKLGGDWVDAGYPAISAKNIKNGKITRHDTIRYLDEFLYQKWMKNPLEQGDIILTSEAPLGEMYFLAEKIEYVLSQRLYGIRADSTVVSGSYLYFWLCTPNARADMENRATGTTVVGIRQSELQKVSVLVPSRAVINAFSNYCDVFLARASNIERGIISLTQLRDQLLPKLLSGELQVSDAEQQFAEVI